MASRAVGDQEQPVTRDGERPVLADVVVDASQLIKVLLDVETRDLPRHRS